MLPIVLPTGLQFAYGVLRGTVRLTLLACLILAFYAPTRAASEPELKAIAPDYVGLTLQRSPVLYYFISKPTSLPTYFTLRDDSRPERAVVDLLLKSPDQAGFWQIRLGDYGIVLDPGVQYRWFISIIQDAHTPSKNPVVGGIIECCPEDLFFVWDSRRCDKETVQVYTEAGIWYDAFACVSDLLKANPVDRELRRLRDDLLGIHELEVS